MGGSGHPRHHLSIPADTGNDPNRATGVKGARADEGGEHPASPPQGRLGIYLGESEVGFGITDAKGVPPPGVWLS